MKTRMNQRLPGLVILLSVLSVLPLAAHVGDPQVKTDNDWYPGELAISTFSDLFTFQDSVYTRETGRSTTSDEDKALASWYYRNWMYYHCGSPREFFWEETLAQLKSKASSGDVNSVVRDYWTGLFSYGFAVCGTTHAQWNGLMEYRLGHVHSRVVGVDGHNSFEVFLTGGAYGAGDWALLDHDISTVVFDDPANPTRLRNLWDICYSTPPLTRTQRTTNDLESILDNVNAPAANRGWFISGLYYPNSNDDATNSDAIGVYTNCHQTEPLGGYAGVPPIVNLKRGEKFRRYLKPGLGGTTYLFWGPDMNGDGIPGPDRGRTWCNQPDKMYQATADTPYAGSNGQYGNGVFSYSPDFSSGAYQDGVISEDGGQVTFYHYSPYAVAADSPTRNQWDVIDADSSGGLVITGSNVGCTVQVSTDNGQTWSSAQTLTNSLDLTDDVKGHHSYYLRFNTAAANLTGKGITIETVVMLNDRTVPHLSDNGSTVTYRASGKAVFAAGPNRDQGQAFITAGGFDSGNTVTLTVPAPGGAKILEVYANAWVNSSSPPDDSINYQIEYSTDGGGSWNYIVQNWNIDQLGYQTDDWWSQSFCFGNKDISSAAASQVQVRFSNDGGKSYRTAMVWLVYETANNSQVKVTFDWNDGAGSHLDSHTYPAGQTTPDSSWTVSTGTSTTTNWVEYEVISQVTDNDGDGMDDSWEAANGLDNTDPNDAGLDPDGDGAVNLHEYLAGTDPQSGSSTPDPGTQTSGGGSPQTVTLGGSTAASDVLLDGYIDAEAPDTDYFSSSGHLQVEGHTNPAVPNRVFVKFDFSSLPSMASIVSATLKLCYSNPGQSTGEPYGLNVGAASTDIASFSDGNRTWTNMSGIIPVSGSADTTNFTAAGTADAYDDLDATNAVSYWLVDGHANSGFIVMFDQESSKHMKRDWWAVDQGGGAYAPQLDITYTQGTTVPNAAPVISVPAPAAEMTVPPSTQVGFTCTATDADDVSGDLVYAWDVDASDGLGFSDGSGASFNYSGYSAEGDYLAVVRVSDPHGGFDYSTVLVHVTSSGVSASPTALTFTADRTNYPNDPASQDVAVTVISGTVDNITGAPAWMTLTNPALPTGSSFTLSVAVSAAGLADGDYSANLLIDGSDNDVTISVNFHVADYAGSADSDSDNMPDDWETAVFGNLSQDGTSDYDSDGASNLAEYQNGTDPTAPTGSMTVSPATLNFTADRSTYPNDPASQDVTVTISSGLVNNVTCPQLWVTLTHPALPTAASFTLTVDVSAAGLADGNNAATITVDGSGNDETVTVNLAVADYAGSADSDSDNMPDDWETAVFGDLNQTAGGDYDSDGTSNLAEYQNGSNPTAGKKSKTKTGCRVSGRNPSSSVKWPLVLGFLLVSLSRRKRR